MTIAPATPGLPMRILRFPLTLLLIEFFGIALVASFSSVLMRKTIYAEGTPWQTLGALFIALATIGAYVFARHVIEGHRGESEFALAGSGKELGLGLLFGLLLFSGMTAVVALLGGFRITGTAFPGQLWSMLAMMIVSSVTEEVLFRGVAFRHLETMLGSWAALFLTSAFFGLGHIFNPNATWFSSLAIALEAGVLLGGAYMLTRRLWLAIGIHGAWNFTQGWVFSVPVSGSKPPVGLFLSERNGPEWLTGGAFGLEASAVAMVVATGAGIWLVRLAVKRGRVAGPMWRNTGSV